MYTPSPAASRRATARIVVAGTPVTDWTRSGHHPATLRRRPSAPRVRSVRYVSSARPSAITTCVRPRRSARSVPGVGCRWMPRPSSVSRTVAVRLGSTTMRPPASWAPVRWPMNGGMVAATLVPSSRTVDAASRSLERERHPTVDAERAVARSRSGRHAEAAVVVDSARAERESGELAQLVGLLVREPPPPKTATASAPCAARMERSRSATRSSAASHSVSCSSPSAPRTSGEVRRSGERRSSADVQPFLHRPPRFVGKSRPETTTGAAPSAAPSARVSVIAHWSAQYGQWVSVDAATPVVVWVIGVRSGIRRCACGRRPVR